MTSAMSIELRDLETPCLLLHEARMQRNILRMQERMNALGVGFRPHVKTSKCVEVVRRQQVAGARGITVSTLKEAERFFADGFEDILYAVAIVPARFDQALRLIRAGLRLTLLLDSVDTAARLSAHGKAHGVCYPVMIEIDTDGHRSGIAPESPQLLAVAAALKAIEQADEAAAEVGSARLRTPDGAQVGAQLVGVMTHAGSSYALNTPEALAAMAEQERAGCVRAAERLRAQGHACPVVSVGSTPTALSAAHLQGVTEVRAGVYVFFDLVMAGTGVCSTDDIALSVLCTVIGHRPETGWLITDAGWMALSRDRGTRAQALDYGYGQVCDAEGKPIDGLVFNDANQEHGVLHWQGDPGVNLLERFPIGSLLRIVPNHACATGAQHEGYRVLDAQGQVRESWSRFNGW